MAIPCTKLAYAIEENDLRERTKGRNNISIGERGFGTALHLGNQIRREQKIPPYSPRPFPGVNNSTFEPAKAMQTIHQN
ncbi:hypothetical protein T08_12895 [Trichinella sp. T8]|nr:hypothetical protein T08_12895 [Trichinella sp. T8]